MLEKFRADVLKPSTSFTCEHQTLTTFTFWLNNPSDMFNNITIVYTCDFFNINC